MSVKVIRPVLTSLDGIGDEFVLNMKDVAAVLDISPDTAGELCATDKLPGAFRTGRLWRISAGNLRRHMLTSTTPAKRSLKGPARL
jgi:hypothetical protein